ncbi:hypothetical protein DRN97_04450 [Methanosarcinales archaeon]|nr:MAG: hypothetical protein DRN97_04450 [Methanosarcinales archaeon]
MTDKRTWQKLEERVCGKFGGKRNPLSGSNSKHDTSADCIECGDLYIEVKLRANFFHHTLFKDVAKKAKKERKLPLLVTHEKGKESELVILKIEDFLALTEVKR